MEGLIKKADVDGLKNVKAINKAMIDFRPHTPVTEWTITDIDDILKGNLHH